MLKSKSRGANPTNAYIHENKGAETNTSILFPFSSTLIGLELNSPFPGFLYELDSNNFPNSFKFSEFTALTTDSEDDFPAVSFLPDFFLLMGGVFGGSLDVGVFEVEKDELNGKVRRNRLKLIWRERCRSVEYAITFFILDQNWTSN